MLQWNRLDTRRGNVPGEPAYRQIAEAVADLGRPDWPDRELENCRDFCALTPVVRFGLVLTRYSAICVPPVERHYDDLEWDATAGVMLRGIHRSEPDAATFLWDEDAGLRPVPFREMAATLAVRPERVFRPGQRVRVSADLTRDSQLTHARGRLATVLPVRKRNGIPAVRHFVPLDVDELGVRCVLPEFVLPVVTAESIENRPHRAA